MCTSKILRFMSHKTSNKNKSWFCKSCLQCFSSENVLAKNNKDCLSINGKQSVKLEEGTIEFENYFRQIPVSFKIYADFQFNLESEEEEIYFNKVTVVGFVKNLLTMKKLKMKKLNIIVT